MFLAFRRRIYIDDLNTYLRSKTKQVIDVGIGSLDSKAAIVLENKDPGQIAFYRDWMLQKGVRISDIYVTFLRKGEGDFMSDYQTVLQREISLFKENCIIINHTKENFEGYVKNVDNEAFKTMLELNGRKDLTDAERETLLELKKAYWVNVREIMNYRVF